MKHLAVVAAVFLSLAACGSSDSGVDSTTQNDIDSPAPVVANDEGSDTDSNEANATTTTDENTAGAGPCIDYEPLNDGIGWNGASECPLPIVQADPVEANPLAGTCVDYEPLNDGIGWNGVSECPLPITQNDPVVNQPEPDNVVVTPPVATLELAANYLQQSVNYYCSVNDSDDGWIWSFSSDNQLRDSENVVVGNWSWTTNNSLTLSPIGNASVYVVDLTDSLGLFNVNDNQQWGTCTIATAEQIRVANLPVYSLADGTTVKGDSWPHTDLTGKIVLCNYWYLIEGVWRPGDGVTLSGIGQTWEFNADGTGQFNTYRMSTNGEFTWTRNSDNEYIVYLIDNNYSYVQLLTDKDNIVWNNNGVWHILPEDNTEVISDGFGCEIL